MDGSRSIEQYGKGNFQRELDFTKQIIDAFRIDEGRARASVILFSTEPDEIFGLDKYKEKAKMFDAIDALKFPAAGSDVGKALTFAQSHSFNYSTPSTSRIVIVVSDGGAKDEIQKPAEALASKGVHVLVVAVGDNLDNDQLETIISGPKEDSIFNFDQLLELVDRINRGVCKGTGRQIVLLENLENDFLKNSLAEPHFAYPRLHTYDP